MRRLLITAAACVLAFSLTSCGKIKEKAEEIASSAIDDVVETVKESTEKETKEVEKPEADADSIVSVAQDGNELCFVIDTDVEISSDGWLGLCEEGTYLYERDADEVDWEYSYPENYYGEDYDPQHSEPYIYRMNVDVMYDQPGKYTLVFCSSDDEYEGYVIAQWPVELKEDGTLEIDHAGMIVNEKPDDLGYDYEDEDDDDEYEEDFDDDEDDEDDYDDEDEYWDDDEDEDDDSASSSYGELSVTGPDDLVSVENEILVCRYTGTAEDLADDDLYVQDYGSDSIYYVWQGFYEDGSLNQVSGYTCLYYFFSDEEAYRAGLELAEEKYELRKQNDEYLYFTAQTTEIEGYDWNECVEVYSTDGDYRHPHFEFVQ